MVDRCNLLHSPADDFILIKWLQEGQQKDEDRVKILTSQPPRGSPLAASNPADIMVKSGANSEAEKECHSMSMFQAENIVYF